MQKKCLKFFVILVLSFVFFCSACLAREINDGSKKEPGQISSVNQPPDCCFEEVKSPRLSTEGYKKKVNNFVVIFDPSASMSEIFNGKTKFELAKCLLERMNNRIPDFKMLGALRTFGCPVYTSLLYGFAEYNPKDFDIALSTLKSADGVSPLDFALRETSKDFDKLTGKSAIIIFTDGKDMDEDVVTEARKLVRKFRDRVCIYGILIGSDEKGKELLERIVTASNCGFLIMADEVNSPQGMDDFVRSVFLCADADKDGVCDSVDECPDTPKGAKVDARGCWSVGVVLFDFDKYNIKSKCYPILNEVWEIMKQNPGLKIKIEGHTDIIGTERYNKKLSIRRANSGKAYLVRKGIKPQRIVTIGYGYSRPRAPSDTEEGRAMNRRIEFKPVR